MKPFFHFFARQHKLAALITLMIIMLGVSSLLDIKRDIYPQVDFGIMTIMTRYPGASSEDVELNVTNKIEEELLTVTGIDRVTSVSMENVSLVTAFIEVEADDQERIKTEIREAANRVTDFPEEVTESPLVKEWSQSQEPVIEIGLSGDIPYKELREYARLFEKKLKNISGVSRTERFGYRAREIRVEVAPNAIDRLQIPLREVISAVRSRNIRGTAGSFESYTSEKDLVTLAQFEDPLEVGDVVVRSSFDGPLIRVKDLAIVNDSFEDERVQSRINGKASISFLVVMSETADVIRTCDAIKALADNERKLLPNTVQVLVSNDTSLVVRNSFDVVLTNGVLGLILILLLLPIFLNFRTAFWIAMGIPVSLLGTIFLLPLFDVYLDTITLTGMILVVGIIVDDAIIIAENIYARREKGDTPLEAAVNGVSEVFLPVLTTVLTTFLVFAPMFFMPGIFGDFVKVIPMAITLALFISLVEVMMALPSHLIPGIKGASLSASRSWFNAVKSWYRGVMLHLVKLRYLLVGLFVVALGVSLWFAGHNIKFILFPSNMAQNFFMVIELPTGTSLKNTSAKVKEIEELVAQLPETELASFNTRIGTNVLINAESENYAAIRVLLTPYAQRDRTADEIVEELRGKTDQLEGFEEIVYSINTGGPPVGKPVKLRIVGSDDEQRRRMTDSVVAVLSALEGVKDITRDDKGGKDQLEIKIDYDKLSRLGLTVADVAQNVRIAYDGEIVTSVRYGDEDVDFRVIIDESARQRIKYLSEMMIPNSRGRLIKLSEAASFKPGAGQPDFRHFDGERSVTVDADLVQSMITPLEVTEKIFGSFDLDRDWPGIQLTLGGEVVETEESMAGLFRTFIIALVAVYFLLVLLFNSITQPLLVMIAIPFGIIGVIAAFGFHGEPFSFTAMMGIIGLSGVVVNDSLVLVNHLNKLKKKRPDDSIVALVAEGTSDRLRAIIMTTLTTVVALLPLAYGLGGTATFMAPMALALGWGLFFATPLTVVLVPCLYVVGEDLGRMFGRKRSAGGKRTGPNY